MKNTIKANRIWNMEDVRAACIRNDLYTCGTSDDYEIMLNLVKSSTPTYEMIFTVAKDIKEHSDYQTITNVMYILENEAVTTCFEIDGSDEI